MPNYKMAPNQPYDSRISSHDDDTFTFKQYNRDTKQVDTVTAPKNQGLLSGLSEGMTMTGAQGATANSIRKNMGWKVSLPDN